MENGWLDGVFYFPKYKQNPEDTVQFQTALRNKVSKGCSVMGRGLFTFRDIFKHFCLTIAFFGGRMEVKCFATQTLSPENLRFLANWLMNSGTFPSCNSERETKREIPSSLRSCKTFLKSSIQYKSVIDDDDDMRLNPPRGRSSEKCKHHSTSFTFQTRLERQFPHVSRFKTGRCKTV